MLCVGGVSVGGSNAKTIYPKKDAPKKSPINTDSENDFQNDIL